MKAAALAALISGGLRRSTVVEIEGLGAFSREPSGRIIFCKRLPVIFLAYVTEDAAMVDHLYTDLTACGYSPWLDRCKLLPGQNWRRRILEAIGNADFFIACYSRNSVHKRSGFQAEVRYALECATRMPLDEVFFIPARFDDCCVPVRIRDRQFIDLFPDWKAGVERIAWLIESQRSVVY